MKIEDVVGKTQHLMQYIYMCVCMFIYNVFQKSLYQEEKSKSALLQTVIRVETCLNVLNSTAVRT
jgi:hypothetical protein